MIDLWWEEARRNDVLAARQPSAQRDLEPAARAAAARAIATCTSRSARRCPSRRRCTCRTASTRSPPRSRSARDAVAEGILLAMGSALGGFALYLRDGRLRYVHNLYAKERHVVGSDEVIAPGAHELAFTFTKTKGFAGTGTLRVDGRVVGEGEIPHFTPMSFSGTGGGLTCGYEVGPGGRRRLRRAVPLQRDDPPGHRRGVGRARTATRWRSSRRSWRSNERPIGRETGDARPRRRRPRRAALRRLVVDVRRAARRAARSAPRSCSRTGRPTRRSTSACCSTTCPSSGCCSARPRSAARRWSASTRPAAAPSSRATCSTPTARSSSPSRRTSTCSRARARSCRPTSLFVVDTPEWDAALAPHAGARSPTSRSSPADVFMLIFTSGTTGAPKAVRMSHGKLTGWGIESRRPLPAHPRRRLLLGDAALPLERRGRRLHRADRGRARPPCCGAASRRAASSPTCASTA